MLLEDQEYDIFVGSKIGSFKHLKYHTDNTKNTKSQSENLTSIKELQKDDGITCMVWGNKEQTEILIGRKNRQVQIYNTEDNEFAKSVTVDYGEGDIVGLGRYKRRLITALSTGVVKVWSKKSEYMVTTGGKLDTLKICPDDDTLFATGGEENDLKIYRIGEQTPTFEAKNLPPDSLQLRQPVWVSALCFLRGEGGALVAAASRHGTVRLYDTRAQRRPVCNVICTKLAATCIAPGFDDKQVLVGFARGQLHQIDLRAPGHIDKGFKGPTGAITCVDTVPGARLVVAVSLGRHLTVHDHTTKKMLFKKYLTSKLTTVLTQTATKTPLRNPHQSQGQELETEVKEEEEVKVEDELDVLFEDMETIGEKPRKQRKQMPTETPTKKLKDTSDSELNETAQEEHIRQLLRSTEKKKRAMERKKKAKKAKSLYHNA